jgi:hypothetical protein
MAIKPPNYAKNAIPTPQGWRDPRTKELLKAQKLSQPAIDEFYGVGQYASAADRRPRVLREAPVNEEEAIVELMDAESEEAVDFDDLNDMTKRELELLAREYGVELDRRKSKDDLVEAVRTLLG